MDDQTGYPSTMRIHTSQSTTGLTTIDCTVELLGMPNLEAAQWANRLILKTIEHAENRLAAHGFALATRQ